MIFDFDNTILAVSKTKSLIVNKAAYLQKKWPLQLVNDRTKSILTK